MEVIRLKFSGKIGFWKEDVEVAPDIYAPRIVERSYVGDLVINVKRFQDQTEAQNDNLNIGNRISIIADQYTQDNIESIRYVIWKQKRWKANTLTIKYPRVEIELGGIYNAPKEIEIIDYSELNSGS